MQRIPSTLSSSRFTALMSVLLIGALVVLGGCDSSTDANGDDPDPPGNGDDPTAPAAPSSLEADSGDEAISLNWSSVSGADSYAVYRSTSSGDALSGNPVSEGIDQTSFTDDSVDNGTTYYYQVTALDEENDLESDGSNEVEITPFPDPPERPSSRP